MGDSREVSGGVGRRLGKESGVGRMVRGMKKCGKRRLFCVLCMNQFHYGWASTRVLVYMSGEKL